MAIPVDIYNKEIIPQASYYDTFAVLVSDDLIPYATQDYVNNVIFPLQTQLTSLTITLNSVQTGLNIIATTYLPLSGGTITGSLSVANVGSTPGRITLFSSTGQPLTLQNDVVFQGGGGPELGLVLPRLLLTQGRFDIDPDTTFNRAEFRLSNSNAEFNIFNKSSLRFYMRIRPDGATTFSSDVSATGMVHSSGAPVVMSSPRFETQTTNISSVVNIVTLSQATYNALTVKQPTTLYVIV